MRALMTATVPSMIGQFNMNNIKILLELGFEVDVACDFNDRSVWSEEKVSKFRNEMQKMGIQLFHIDFSRSPGQLKKHIVSYHEMKKLMADRKYDLIHTHTPISSFITRLAFKNSSIFESCRMIYTAHGFHFFKGNSVAKNFIFKSIEKYAAKYTDILITINREDYEAAKKFKLRKNGRIEYVPGVGINLEKINSINEKREEFLKELNLSEDSFLMLSVGELNENKNHKAIVEILNELPRDVHYLICGQGNKKEELIKVAEEKNCKDRLHLLGYREDIIAIMKSCDLFVFPSMREGLSVALMEAIACGLPCVVSDIRGNRDLIKDGKNGYLSPLDSFLETIRKTLSMDDKSFKMISQVNIDESSKYSEKNISEFYRKLIESILC